MTADDLLEVDGTVVKCPSAMTWGLQDVSKSDAGRTNNALMHKNRIAQKRTISLTWNGLTRQECHKLVKAFNPEYISVRYYDPLDGELSTRTFYVGDRTAPVAIWFKDKKIYQNLSFDIIER